MHKGCLKHGTHHKAYKLCVKHNPKSLQKQHGYKQKIYWKTSSIYRIYQSFQKASMSFKFKNKH